MRLVAAVLLLTLLLGCALPRIEPAHGPKPTLRFLPDAPPRAVVLALHGFNDRKAAFAGFGAFLAANGVALVAYDQQGFGANPDRGFWPGADALVDDAAAAVRATAAEFPHAALYVLGESMGVATLTLMLARPDAPPVDGAILVAPGVWGGDALNPFYRLLLWAAVHVAPGYTLTGKGLNRRPSDNVPMLRELGRDPLTIKATRIDAIAGAVGLMGKARAAAAALRVPSLVLLGTNDQIVPPGVQASFTRDIAATDCTAVRYAEGWHMLLRDLERERVWKDVLAWIGTGRPLATDAVPCRRLPDP
ncbi:MAG: alpha/beta hydrolase [Geminicoccaceae bacterium]|nr:alpha/beta hydrolase [Geminicoccaceae bacterium]